MGFTQGRVYNYQTYQMVGISTIMGVSLLPGMCNFVLKAGDTMCIGGNTLQAIYDGGSEYKMIPQETINTDGASQLWVGFPGVTATAYLLVSRTSGFENT